MVSPTQDLQMGLMGDGGLPGVFFTYELSPMMVKYTEKQRSAVYSTYIIVTITVLIFLI